MKCHRPILTFTAILLVGASAIQAQPTVRLPTADRGLPGGTSAAFAVGVRGSPFTDVGQVAFGPDEHLYVLDRGARRVSVFDRAGRAVRSFGVRGNGAGQFLAPVQMAVTRNGEVVVSDVGRRRYVVFGTDGRLRREIQFEAGKLPGLTLRPSPRGGFVTAVRPAGMEGPLGGATRNVLSLMWQPLTADARPVQLFEHEEEAAQTAEAPAGGAERRLVAAGPPTFSPGMHWGVLPNGGAVVATSPAYRVRVIGPGGTTDRVIERPIPPRRVTDRDRERARAQLRSALSTGRGLTIISASGSGLPRALVDEQVSGMRFATVLPVVRGITVAPSGTVWIERSGPDTGGPGAIDLVTSAGRYVGTLAAQQRPEAISPTGRAAYIETDAAGRSSVVVRVLPAAWR
ncbi:MAG TPA: 6-bladed beta-propeller [Longimicrobium sp.]|nr:6-bladed beta-propeller [Longimicrobium sp.]